jgi:hypothetical protein
MSLTGALLSTPLGRHGAWWALKATGTLLAGASPTPSVPAKPDFNPSPQAGVLLNYLAWGVSAASVAGLMIIGTQLALQLRRGEMGEGATYFRGGFFVMVACTLGTCAKPIFDFVIAPFV